MATIQNLNYAELQKTGQTSYVDPATGKVTYVDKVGPQGKTLTPMYLADPGVIAPTATPSNSLDDMVHNLLKSMAPSASGSPAAKPFSFDLKSMVPSFSGIYQAPTGVSDTYFNDYINKIGAPSSVDQVQKGLDSQSLEQMLAEIQRGTDQNVGSLKMDFLDRGLGGPGQVSDIEANAIAQARTGGERNKSAARLNAYQAELARQKAREDAVNSAYGQRYTVGAAADTQGRDIAAKGAMTDEQVLSDMLGKEYAGSVTQREGMLDRSSKESMNYMTQLLDYAMKSGTLSQQDAQFYAKLISDETEGAANRQSAYDRALLGTRKEDKSPMGQIGDILGLIKTGTGIASDLYAPGAGKGLLTK